MNVQDTENNTTRNLATANRSLASCTHNTSRAFIVTLWTLNLG